jgi:hypothetical protein
MKKFGRWLENAVPEICGAMWMLIMVLLSSGVFIWALKWVLSLLEVL